MSVMIRIRQFEQLLDTLMIGNSKNSLALALVACQQIDCVCVRMDTTRKSK